MLVTRATGRCSKRAGGGLGHHVRHAGRAPLRNDDRARAGRVRGADDRAQVVRILHAVEHHDQFRAAPRFEVGVLPRRAHRDDALVRSRPGQPVERGARLEAHRDAGAPRQVDNLLHARSAGALRDQDAFQGRARAQRFDNRMNAAKNHGSPLLRQNGQPVVEPVREVRHRGHQRDLDNLLVW